MIRRVNINTHRSRTGFVQSALYKLYAKVIDPDGNELYFKSNENTVDGFKNAIASYYAENYDPADAYNLKYPEISNVKPIGGLSEDKFIVV